MLIRLHVTRTCHSCCTAVWSSTIWRWGHMWTFLTVPDLHFFPWEKLAAIVTWFTEFVQTIVKIRVQFLSSTSGKSFQNKSQVDKRPELLNERFIVKTDCKYNGGDFKTRYYIFCIFIYNILFSRGEMITIITMRKPWFLPSCPSPRLSILYHIFWMCENMHHQNR